MPPPAHYRLREKEQSVTARQKPRRVILEIDERGRVSLARFGFRSMQVVVDPTDDGGLVLHPAIALTPAEAAHY